MKTKKKKLIACTCLLLTVFVFTACADKPMKPQATDGVSRTETEEPIESETEEPAYEPPVQDLGKSEFVILATDDLTDSQQNVYHDDMDGEPINDAIHLRDCEVEERLNVKLNYIVYDNLQDNYMRSLVEKSVHANEDLYDMVIGSPWFLFTRSDYLHIYMDLCELPYLSLEESWWSPSAYQNLRICDRLFFTVGPISPMYYATPSCVIFNKRLMEDYDLGNPYDWVRDGTWTFPKLFSITDTFSRDLNADGKMIFGEDLYGASGLEPSSGLDAACATIACGIKQIEAKGDTYINNLGSEKMVDIVTMFGKRFSDGDRYHVGSSTDGLLNGNLLFSLDCLRSCWKTLRNMDDDYGILPMPKYDEEQPEYHSGVNAIPAAGICVPVTAEETERNGLVMENLAFYSEKYVRPATHDVTILGKIARDENSIEMLELIYDTIDYEFNEFFNVNSSSVFLGGCITQDKEYLSRYTKIESRLIKALDDLFDQ